MSFSWSRALLLGALWLFGFAAHAQGVLALPELRARVTDQTGTLDAGNIAALEARLAAFETQRGTQVAVLIVPTTQPEDIAESIAYMVTRHRRSSIAELWAMPTSQA